MGFFGGIASSLSGLLGSGAAGAVSPWSAIGGVALQSGLDFWQTERANSMNRKHDWAMWNAQNEYNLPKNQMARFKEAGLNPNLIYGQTNLASPVHSSSAQAGMSPNFLSAMQAYQSMKQQDAMTQQIEAQQKLLEAQRLEVSARTREADVRSKIQEHNFNLIDGTDYILGENGWSQLRRHVSSGRPVGHYDPKANPDKQVIVKDTRKPALFDNVISIPNGWMPQFF